MALCYLLLNNVIKTNLRPVLGKHSVLNTVKVVSIKFNRCYILFVLTQSKEDLRFTLLYCMSSLL